MQYSSSAMPPSPSPSSMFSEATHFSPSHQSTYSTVAVFSSSTEVPITAFCVELAHALTVSG